MPFFPIIYENHLKINIKKGKKMGLGVPYNLFFIALIVPINR